jgi:rare lipoprotein A (peptidoglycan hydrolase)
MVVVESAGRSVVVRLVDTCACPNGRLLDLYSDAFLRLAPLDRGLVRVTVTW